VAGARRRAAPAGWSVGVIAVGTWRSCPSTNSRSGVEPLPQDAQQTALYRRAEDLRAVANLTPGVWPRHPACSSGSDGCQRTRLDGVTDRSDPALCHADGGTPIRSIADVLVNFPPGPPPLHDC